MKEEKSSLTFSILIRKEDDIFVAHCLELDVVATAPTFAQVRNDIADLVLAQVSFAYENDNLKYLYKPAPKEVYDAFLKTDVKTKTISKPKAPPITLSTSSYTSALYVL